MVSFERWDLNEFQEQRCCNLNKAVLIMGELSLLSVVMALRYSISEFKNLEIIIVEYSGLPEIHKCLTCIHYCKWKQWNLEFRYREENSGIFYFYHILYTF